MSRDEASQLSATNDQDIIGSIINGALHIHTPKSTTSTQTQALASYCQQVTDLEKNPSDENIERIDAFIDTQNPEFWLLPLKIKVEQNILVTPPLLPLISLYSIAPSNQAIFQLVKKTLEKAPPEALSYAASADNHPGKGNTVFRELTSFLNQFFENEDFKMLVKIADDKALPIAYEQRFCADAHNAKGDCPFRELGIALINNHADPTIQTLFKNAMKKANPRAWLLSLESGNLAGSSAFPDLTIAFSLNPDIEIFQDIMCDILSYKEIQLAHWCQVFTCSTYAETSPLHRLFHGLSKCVNGDITEKLVNGFIQKLLSEPDFNIGPEYLYTMISAFIDRSG